MRLVIMNAEGWPGMAHAADLLQKDAPNFDVIEEGIKLVELESSVKTVGFGGLPNALGVMQLDASLMNGDTLEAAALGALEGIMHPISVARELMKRLPHVMLVGQGARQLWIRKSINFQLYQPSMQLLIVRSIHFLQVVES